MALKEQHVLTVIPNMIFPPYSSFLFGVGPPGVQPFQGPLSKTPWRACEPGACDLKESLQVWLVGLIIEQEAYQTESPLIIDVFTDT